MARERKAKSPEQTELDLRPATTVRDGKVHHTVIDNAPKHDHDRVVTGDGTINVSQSKVKLWRRCRRAYHYKFVEMLKKKKVKRPFTFGGIVHEMLEAHAEGDNPFEVLERIELEKGAYFRREIEMYGNILEDIRVIMTDYFDHWGEDAGLQFIRKNKRSSEHEFRIELRSGLWFTGRIDGAVNARRMRWVKENKSFSRTPSEDARWRSVQGAVYFRAFEMMGWQPFDGILWDYICSKPPSVPERLKSGEWSQKKISTLPTKLEEFFAEHDLKAKDFPKLMDEARENRGDYFFRVFNPVKKHVVGMLFDDFCETAEEIAAMHGKVKSRNIDQHCGWCDYEPLCRAELTKSDVDFIKEHEYIITDEDDGAETADE